MEKVKVTKVNDFEFQDNSKSGYYPALINVKIKNAVKEVKFTYEKNYDKNNNPEEVCYNFVDNSFVESVKELGIEVELNELKEEYKNLVKIEIEKDKQKRIEKRKEDYDKSWVHNFIFTVKNELTEVELSSLKMEPNESKEEYTNGSLSLKVKLSYKGKQINVDIENFGGNRYGRGGTEKYTFSCSLNNYTHRGYVKSKSLVKKFMELVDEKTASREAKDNEEIKRISEKNKIQKQLEKLLGRKVKAEDKYNRGRTDFRGRSIGRGYNTNRYTIEIENKQTKEKYTVTVYLYDDGKIGFNGMEMTVEQTKQIINILEK